MNRVLPCLLIAYVVSGCANGVNDAADTVVSGVSGIGTALARPFASSTRVDWPFGAGVKGRMLLQQVNIAVERDYAMTLRLHFGQGAAARARVIRVAGTSPGSTAGIAEAGAAVPVHVRIARIVGPSLQPVFDATSTNPDLDGFADRYYSRGIGVVHLAPGLYQLSVEALQDVPALEYVPVTFHLAPAPAPSHT